MLIVGLTGSIGMGKSTAAARFRHHGIAVFDADAEVHRLYDHELVTDIGKAFPGSVHGGKVDRAKLSHMLLLDPRRFKVLENIVHPKVRERQRDFLATQFSKGAPIAVVEIPLLFEVGGDRNVDIKVVVSAGRDIQRARVLPRPGMTPEKFEAITSRQIADEVKRERADFIVDTTGSIENCNSQIDAIIAKIGDKQGTAFEKVWRA